MALTSSTTKDVNMWAGGSQDIILGALYLEDIIDICARDETGELQLDHDKYVVNSYADGMEMLSAVVSYIDPTHYSAMVLSCAAKYLKHAMEMGYEYQKPYEEYWRVLNECMSGNPCNLNSEENRAKIHEIETMRVDLQGKIYCIETTISIRKAEGKDTSELEAKLESVRAQLREVDESRQEILGLFAEYMGISYVDLEAVAQADIAGVKKPSDIASKAKYDPLILDIDGDGFQIEKKEDGTYFDLNKDGFAENINWTRKDAILAIDRNQNGIIDDGNEVFSDFFEMEDGTIARNGFEALASFDSNGDGVIDSSDEAFQQMRLWIDANGDGISQEEELYTMQEMNIQSFHLNYDVVNMETGTEATISGVASAENSNGTIMRLGELWVASDLYDSREKEAVEVSEIVAVLPDVRSFGKVNSLHTAMMKDVTGKLQELVQCFGETSQMDQRMELAEQIVHIICGTDEVEEGSRGSYFDARKLALIEAFLGESYVGTRRENPIAEAVPSLKLEAITSLSILPSKAR